MTAVEYGGITIKPEHEKACEAISQAVYKHFEAQKLDVSGWQFKAALARQEADEKASAMTIYASKPGSKRLAFTHIEPAGVVTMREEDGIESK